MEPDAQGVEGDGRKTIGTLVAGILVIAFSTVLIGLGNDLQGAIGAH